MALALLLLKSNYEEQHLSGLKISIEIIIREIDLEDVNRYLRSDSNGAHLSDK